MTANHASRGRVRTRGAGFDLVEWPRLAGSRYVVVSADDRTAPVATVRIGRSRGRAECVIVPTPAARGLSLRGLAAPLARLLAPSRTARVVLRRGARVAARAEGPPARALPRALSRGVGNAPKRLDRAYAARLGVPDDYGIARRLAPMREPETLAFAGIDVHGREQWLAPEAARAWRRIERAAAREGIEIALVSAFRSVAYQARLVERKLANAQPIAQILEANAAPGYSEHHTGRALDLTTPGHRALEEEFESSPAFEWLARNAARFGFRLSYPRDNPHGIAYEPWHWYFEGEPRGGGARS